MAHVLIVGAGPTGLTLALSLTQNGIPVRIVEKLSIPSDSQRGTGQMPRTLEIWKFMGILDDILEAGRPIIPMKQYDKEGKVTKVQSVVMGDHTPTPAIPWRDAYIIGQETAARVLSEHLSKLGVNVEFGSELVGLQQHETHVTASVKKGSQAETQTFDVKYVVGTDGARGVVRKMIGLELLGETKQDVTWAVGDVRLRGLDLYHWHNFGDAPGDVVSLLPTKRAFTEDLFFCVCMGSREDMEKAVNDKEHFIKFIRKVSCKPDLEIREVKSVALYRPNNTRVVKTFNEGRVFLAGDAAHVHSSTGGQGLNSGIMDAFNLGWKLALVIKGLSPSSLLDTYTEERLPVIQDMLRRTQELLKKTMDPNRKESALLRPQVLQQLGVNYRSSSIVVDDTQDEETAKQTITSAYETDDVLRAGVRAPDAPELRVLSGSPTTTTRLFDIFHSTHHTVLFLLHKTGSDVEADIPAVLDVLSRIQSDVARTVAIYAKGSTPDSNDTVKRADVVLEDRAGHTFDAYGSEEGESRIVVVRPDGYVGAIVKNAEGVRRYLGKVFVGF